MKLKELIPGLLIGAAEVPAGSLAELSEMGVGRILQLQWVDHAGEPEGDAEAVELRENGEVQGVLLEWKDGEWLQGEVLTALRCVWMVIISHYCILLPFATLEHDAFTSQNLG